jgi:hypothetical protein
MGAISPLHIVHWGPDGPLCLRDWGPDGPPGCGHWGRILTIGGPFTRKWAPGGNTAYMSHWGPIIRQSASMSSFNTVKSLGISICFVVDQDCESMDHIKHKCLEMP